MTPSRRVLEGVGFVVLLAAALALFAWRCLGQTWGLSADQAESLTLARSLVEGFGLRLTPASSVSAGPPNLAWLFAQVAVLRLGLEPALWLPRVAAGFLGLALVTVALRGAWVWRRVPRLEDALPVLGLSLATAMAEAAALGSGASIWVFALALVSIALGRGLGTGRGTSTGLAIGALSLLRPSAAWLLLASGPAWWIAARLEGRRATRETARFIVAGLFAIGLIFGARFTLWGALPLEGVWPSEDGVPRTLEFLGRQSRWFWAALTGTLIAAVWRRFHLRGGGTLLAWVLMTVLLACWTDAPRALFLGCVPLLAMLVGDGLSAARDGVLVVRSERPLVRLSWAGFGAGMVMLSLATLGSYALGPIMGVWAPVEPRPALRDEWVRRDLQQPLVAWTDGAEAAVLFPGARVVVFARNAGREVEDLLLSEGPPDVVDARIPIERMPGLAAFLEAGPGGARWLSEQSPDEDPRCPEGRLALLSTTPEDLAIQVEQAIAEEQLQRGLQRWRCARAALEEAQLPSRERRQQLSSRAAARATEFERQGRLELAVRAASLATELSDEDVTLRSRTERLRTRWLRE